MPTYNVYVTHTCISNYSDIEIEADDEAEAKRLAEEMVDDDEVAADDVSTKFTTTAMLNGT